MSRRIALVIGQLGHGGAEKQLSMLARGLIEAGEDTRVICLSQVTEPFGPRLERAGVPLMVIPRRGSYEPWRALRLAACLRRERIDLVHSFLESASIYSYLASFYYHKALLIPAMRTLPTRESITKRALLRRALRSASLVTVNSGAGATAYAERYRVDPGKFALISNGVEPVPEVSDEERGQARKKLGLSSGRPVIGTVGKDDPDKNIPAFLELVGALGQSLGGVCSVLAGRGLDERYAVRRGVSRLSTCESYFLGELDDMRQFYAALDLLVLPSLREGLPNSLLEAAAHGVPAVAFHTGGVPEVIENNRTGVVVPLGDERAMLAATGDLLADRERLRSMSEAAREKVYEKFGLEEMVSATRQVYDRAFTGR
jgi:glycosyltransferase involved in cell wall biosynthesis